MRAAASGEVTNPEQRKQIELDTRAAIASARTAYAEIEASTTPDLDVIRSYVRFLQMTGDYDLAATQLERAIVLAPDDMELYLSLGRTYFHWGPQYAKKAEDILKKALTINANSPAAGQVYVLLGRVYVSMGLYDFAAENFTAGLELDPANSVGHIGKACMLIRDGKMAEGDAILDKLNELPPQYAAVLEEMLAAALQDFESAGKWFPDTAEDHLAYAKALLRASRLPASEGPLKRSLKLKSDNYVAYNMLGNVQRSLGKMADARAAFRSSLALNPDQPRTQEALQQVLDYEAAQQQAQPAPVPVPTPPAAVEPAPAPGPAEPSAVPAPVVEPAAPAAQ